MNIDIDYESYIASESWKLMRNAKLFLDGQYDEWGFIKCEQCSSWYGPMGIHIHHNTYKRLGNEALADLDIVCAFCHAAKHGIEPTERDAIAAVASSLGGIYETRVQALRRRFELLAMECIEACRQETGNTYGRVPCVSAWRIDVLVRHFWDIRELMRTDEIKKRISAKLLDRVYDHYKVPAEMRKEAK